MQGIGENIYFTDEEQTRFGVPSRMGSGAARLEVLRCQKTAQDVAIGGAILRLESYPFSQAIGGRREALARIDMDFVNQLYQACSSYDG